MKAMKTNQNTRAESNSREGFIMFYTLGMLALLSLAALIALTSSRLEARTARNHLAATQALYHAEAGARLVRQQVENRLHQGERLSSILSDLSVSAPFGLDFDTIDTFNEIVPERLFGFESVGRSGDAVARVVVQYRRQPIINFSFFGNVEFLAQNHVSVYGYDSRLVSDPTPADNNGGASIGSNNSVSLANNNFNFNGTILLGETGNGLVASCNNCNSEDFTLVEVGYVDPDPLGLLDGSGTMSNLWGDNYESRNNQDYNSINMGPNQHRTLTAGDYYLDSVYLGPNSSLTVDASDGPVRIFLSGEFRMQPMTSNLIVNGESPMDFQIYSTSSQDIRLQPMGNLSAYIYAPDALVFLLPMGDFRGNVWANRIQIQPMGQIYGDTSLADRMLSNNLDMHAWYEQHGM